MAIKKYDFKSKNNDSKRTESFIANYLKSIGYVVFDVSDIESYQAKDIDFLAYPNCKRDLQVKLEVKSDTYDSPNYFAEVVSNTTKNTLGCWLATEADYLLYYFEKLNECHIIPVAEAQQYVLDRYDNLKSILVSTIGDNGKVLYHTEGKLINKKQIQKCIDIDIIKF